MQEFPNPPARNELLELYKVATEEYRFQVKLNADRSRDYVVVNSAIIAAGITLLGQSHLPLLASLVFLVGFVVAALAILGTHTQHGYYRDARNQQAQIGSQLGIGGQALIRTKPSGSRYRRFVGVTTLNYVILSLLCLVDLTGGLTGLGVIQIPKAPMVTSGLKTASPSAPSPGVKLAAPGGVTPSTPRHPSQSPARPRPATPPPP